MTQRRGSVQLELFSLLALLLVGALAIGATSASAEEENAPGAGTTPAVTASSGGAGEVLDGAEAGVVVRAAEAGPVDAEFEACMREQGVELPGPTFHESTDNGNAAGPAVESVPVDEAFVEAAEQCGHEMDVFTHQFEGDAPAVTAEEVAAFDECLRAAGVDVPSPEAAPTGVESETGAMSMQVVLASSDPAQQAAFEQCAALLPDGVVTVEAPESD